MTRLDQLGELVVGTPPPAPRGRPGGFHLDEERARGDGVALERAEVAVQRRGDELVPVGVGCDLGSHAREQDVDERVVSGEEAVLLVLEVLVERAWRDPGAAADLGDGGGGVALRGHHLHQRGLEPGALRGGDLVARQPVRSARERVRDAEDPVAGRSSGSGLHSHILAVILLDSMRLACKAPGPTLLLAVVVLLMLYAAPAAAAWQPGPAKYGARKDTNVPVTMSDGTVLRANVYHPTDPATGPDAPGPFPVIMG